MWIHNQNFVKLHITKTTSHYNMKMIFRSAYCFHNVTTSQFVMILASLWPYKLPLPTSRKILPRLHCLWLCFQDTESKEACNEKLVSILDQLKPIPLPVLLRALYGSCQDGIADRLRASWRCVFNNILHRTENFVQVSWFISTIMAYIIWM